MPRATYRGPKARLRISETGRVIVRGRSSQVTHREAVHLAASNADVHVEGVADLSTLTVTELRRLCRDEGLPTDGKKAELVDRLSDTTIGDGPADD